MDVIFLPFIFVLSVIFLLKTLGKCQKILRNSFLRIFVFPTEKIIEKYVERQNKKKGKNKEKKECKKCSSPKLYLEN